MSEILTPQDVMILADMLNAVNTEGRIVRLIDDEPVTVIARGLRGADGFGTSSFGVDIRKCTVEVTHVGGIGAQAWWPVRELVAEARNRECAFKSA